MDKMQKPFQITLFRLLALVAFMGAVFLFYRGSLPLGTALVVMTAGCIGASEYFRRSLRGAHAS